MRVFFSWSGELSWQLAKAFDEWLPSVLQAVDPYLSSEGIEKGKRWSTEIAIELENSAVGLLFLTRSNLNAPWLLFEAGALSKQLDSSRVCPLLFGISPFDIPEPLAQFQATEFGKVEMLRLLNSFNNASDRPIRAEALNGALDYGWPRIETKVLDILSTNRSLNTAEREPSPAERDLREILLAVRQLHQANPIVQGFTADALKALHELSVDIKLLELFVDEGKSHKELREKTRNIQKRMSRVLANTGCTSFGELLSKLPVATR